MSLPVLVTGMGVVSSIGTGVAAFAQALRAGTSGVVAVPASDAGPAGFIAPLPPFELAAELDSCIALDRVTRNQLWRSGRRSPVAVRASLVAAAQAWQDALLADRAVPPDRVGLVVGGNNLTTAYAFDLYEGFLRESAYLPVRYPLQVQDTDHVATLSEGLGIRGEGCTVGASSASGNMALVQAARLVGSGTVDVCLAVGPMARLGPLDLCGLAAISALAPAGTASVPFDRQRRGMVPGEASACLVLESAGSARRRLPPDRVRGLAEVAGTALFLDGSATSAPHASGEARAVRAALARAGVAAADVDYVNAHATGTPQGDAVELDVLDKVFAGSGARPWVNSTKALTGHCLSAAGVLEAVATVVQLQRGFVHPNLALDPLSATTCRVVGRSAEGASLRWALSNGFGFGGFSSAVVLART